MSRRSSQSSPPFTGSGRSGPDATAGEANRSPEADVTLTRPSDSRPSDDAVTQMSVGPRGARPSTIMSRARGNGGRSAVPAYDASIRRATRLERW